MCKRGEDPDFWPQLLSGQVPLITLWELCWYRASNARMWFHELSIRIYSISWAYLSYWSS